MMDELLEQFVIEGRELVQQAVDGLLALEQAGYEAEPTDSLFRAIHTLKGSAGLFDAAPLGDVLHAAEDVIAAARDRRQAPGDEAIETLLDCCSQVEIWIEAMARTEGLSGDAAARAAVLVAALRAAMDGAPPEPDAEPQPAAETPDWMARLLADDGERRAQTAIRYEPAPGCFFVGDDPLALVRTVPSLVALRIEPRQPWSVPDHDPFTCNLVISALSAAPIGRMLDLFRAVRDQVAVLPVPVIASSGPPEKAITTGLAPATVRRTVRVEEDRIDGLGDLVSELFVTKNRLAQTIAQVAAVAPDLARELAANQAAFDRLAGGMHRAVMQIRRLPLDHSLRRLPRVVREVANQLGVRP